MNTQVRRYARTAYWKLRRLRAASPSWTAVKSGPLHGCQLYLSPDAQWSAQMAQGDYDPYIYHEAITSGNLQGKTVWDVGAHIGYHTLGFAGLVGERGHVHAFEPNPANQVCLEGNVKRNFRLAGRIVVHAMALSGQDGTGTLITSPSIISGKSMGSHLEDALCPLTEEHYKDFGVQQVTMLRGDTLVERGISLPPAMMKVDVEGAEIDVLNGCRKILTTYRPIILAEIHNIVLMAGVQKLLFQMQYEVEVLHADPNEKSRCFILATPKSS
jgi:FkbM family methyltransferase